MTRTLFIILLLLTFFVGTSAAEPKVLALQSVAVAPYELALRGFERAFGSPVQRLYLSDLPEKEILKRVRELRPELVLAMGRDALSVARKIKNLPVVYCMVLNPQSLLAGERNISGVSMNLTPEKQLGELVRVLPAARSIGLLYDPEQSGDFVRGLREAAIKMDVRVTARAVRRPRDVPLVLKDLKGRAGVFWMLPDTTVLTPETMESILLFSLETNMPVLTFSEKYLELGATLSIGIDPFDIGWQAGELARNRLSRGLNKDVQYLDARRAVISVNEKTAQKLGITIDPQVLRNSRGVR